MTRVARLPAARASSRNPVSVKDKQRLRLWLKLLRTSRGIEVELRTRLRRTFDVTLPHFDVMAALARAPEGMTMTELSRFLVVSNGNVTSIIDTMVADGFVVRVPSAQDRRATFVRLTASGTRQFASMASEHHEWIEEILGSLATREVETMHGLLDGLQISSVGDGATK